MGMGDKTVRELFVGNTPQGTSDFVLLEFLNAAMKQVRLLCFFFYFCLMCKVVPAQLSDMQGWELCKLRMSNLPTSC